MSSMSSTDLHKVVFKWPHTEPTTVIVTGTFDKWASSIHLVKVPTGFEGVTQIPWEQKIKYKFIVDGKWLVHEDQPTEVDPGGFVNNIYTAPAKPVILPALETTSLPLGAETIAVEANNHRTNGDSVVAEVVDKPEYTPQPLPKHDQSLTDTDASTIAARDGTSSALAYVASGLGAAMHSAVGIDPINIPKISIPTPKPNDDFSLPPSVGTISPTIKEESAPKGPSSPIAPLVPIMIVPVNAAENNTVVSSPPPESMHVLPRIAPSQDPPVVNKPHIPESVVEESTERKTESTPAPVSNDLTSETVIHESALAEAEVIHVKSEAPVEKFRNDFPVLSETATTPANVEAEPVSTSSGTPTVAEVSVSNILVEQSTTDPEPVVPAVVPPTDPNLVTEEKAQTPTLVPEARDVQPTKPSAIDSESHAGDAVVVIERKVAESTPTPTIPTTFRKKKPTTSSKDMQEFPSNSPTIDNSPSSSRFNSLRKKRTSILGKIKKIFHHDKEKEKEMK